MKTKIVFMGTPEFGAIILEQLINSGYKPILVVTAPDKPVGRKQILTPPPIKTSAQKYNISIAQPEKIKNLETEIKNLRPDLGIVAAYGQIIPENILDLPRFGFLNVHPSLLPKYRGASPVQYAILSGDKETGVTIMLLDKQMDHGSILAQEKTEIKPNETTKELRERLANLGAKLLAETIPDWVGGKIQSKPQNETEATYTKILKKKDGKINWGNSAESIERQVRALNPWPGAYTEAKINGNKKTLKILKAKVLKVANPAACPVCPVGKTLVAPQNELCVQTGQGFLVIAELQLEGKRPMGSEEFLRGHEKFIGTILK